MITVILQGGIGNQMFQYAFGRAQAKRLGVEVQFDATRLAVNRPFSLGQWDIDAFRLSPRMVPTVREVGLPYNQKLVDNIRDGDVLQGYWQSEKYFENVREELRNLNPLNRRKDLESQILAEENAVAIHVRRGDYIQEPHKSFHGNLDYGYYGPARQYIRDCISHPKFFFFTDNPKWVSETFYTDFSLGRDVVVEPGTEATDIYAMSLCDHVITANSSFSWWAAYFKHPYGTVIAPKNWFGPTCTEDARDICPERWVRL